MSLKNHFQRVLRGSEAQRIRFTFRGVGGFDVTVDPQNFRLVAAAIDHGTITLSQDETNYSAQYQASTHHFTVKPEVYNTIRNSRQFDALLIHESVHASFHLMGLRIPAFDNETAGYLAQGYYLRNSGFKNDDVLNELEFSGKYSIEDGGRINDSMLMELRKALLTHPSYQGQRRRFIINILGFDPWHWF